LRGAKSSAAKMGDALRHDTEVIVDLDVEPIEHLVESG
jgi:hypothetical protein